MAAYKINATGSATTPPTEHYLVGRLKVPMPKDYHGLQRASVAYPECVFEIASFMISGDELTVTFCIVGDASAEEVREILLGSPGVRDVEFFASHGGKGLFRVSSDVPRPSLALTLHRNKVLPDFPYEVKDGVINLEIVTSLEKFYAIHEATRQDFPDTQLVSIRHEYVTGLESLLTPRQLEIFRIAMFAGYWDVPRRTTLTDIALSLNRSKSTVAETLSTIEMKLLHHLPGFPHQALGWA